MNNRKRTQQLTLAAFFVAIEVIMSVTPIGYIPVGALNITTMHIPVILAGCVLGPSYGAGMGFLFGLTSMLKATFQPGITSFVFSPFVTVGGVSGNFASLLIAFVPRILLGWLGGTLYRLLAEKTGHELVGAGIAAGIATFVHTALVLGGIWVFFGEPYAAALGLSQSALATALLAVVTSNGILELAFAAIVIPVLIRALAPSAERMGLYRPDVHKKN